MPLKRESLLWILVVMVLATISVVYFIERPEHLNPITVFGLVETTVLVVGILVFVFVTWAWHLRWFRGWLVTVPDVRGTWRGTLTAVGTDETAGIRISCTLLIRQTLLSVRCTMYTEAMHSESFGGSASLDEETGQGRLVYSYSTDPRLSERAQNPRHDGTAVLDLRAEPVCRLIGKYFTDRCTRGDIFVQLHSRKHDPALVS